MYGVKNTTKRTKNVLSWVEFWNDKIDFPKVKNEETVIKKEEKIEKNEPLIDFEIAKKEITFTSNDSDRNCKEKIPGISNSTRLFNSNKQILGKQYTKGTSNCTPISQFFLIIKTAEQIINETEQILNFVEGMINTDIIINIASVAFNLVILVKEINQVMTNIKKTLTGYRILNLRKNKNIQEEKSTNNYKVEKNFETYIVGNSLSKQNELFDDIETKNIMCHFSPEFNMSDKTREENEILTKHYK